MDYIVSHDSWGAEGGYVITVRHKEEKPWTAVPIGPAMSRASASIISNWLQNNLSDMITATTKPRGGL